MVRAVCACGMAFDGGGAVSSWLVVVLVYWVSSSYDSCVDRGLTVYSSYLGLGLASDVAGG
jgi:hypothetical protein